MSWDFLNNYVTYDRWYLGAVLLLFGLFQIWNAKRSKPLSRFFPHGLDAEFAEALKRREELESLPAFMWQVPGALFVVLGVVVLCGWMSGVLAYAISYTCYMALHAWVLLRMRNTGPRRAALLTPRRFDAIVPPWQLIIGLVASLAPLAMVDVEQVRISAIIVTCCSLATIFISLRMNAMPAMMAGEHPVAELEIERTLRCIRVKTVFFIATGMPFVFVVFAHLIASPTPWHAIAYLLTLLIFGTMILPHIRYMARLVTRRGHA